ncbi:hypothetical protein B0J15DRAFT_530267 [Fusarium solani]|uniref:Uncharacterized protein n=1 Tax=Fusarium solani TaxID=169388 RepID=A0A9P9JPR5_FUSSL|nr:uncharacterized protein B0J15DRAFT_530267 [Fusarium solani]KAH7232468.1 hypothetical protein B0J15DRAFT_530267 [Fusarium solani]
MADSASEVNAPAWPRDPDVKAEIETYRKAMKSYADNYSLHPWMENILAVESRLRILDLQEGHGDSTATEPGSPQDTWLYLEKALSDAFSTEPGRHLILLEGMNPRLAEVLGVKLDIPPEFWFSHWDYTAELRVFDPSIMNQGSSTYWKVPVPQLHSVAEDLTRPEGVYTICLGNCPRNIHYCGKAKQGLNVNNIVSYWGRTYAEKSWIALVLVDIPMGYLIPRFSPPSGFINPVLLRAPAQTLAVANHFDVVLSPLSYKTRRIYPLGTSMWDISVEAYKTERVIVTDDPFSATALIRNFIVCAWEAWNAHEIKRMNVVWRTDSRFYRGWNAINLDQKEEALVDQSKKASLGYESLMNERHQVQQSKSEIQQIIRAFRWDSVNYSSPQQDSTLRLAISNEARRWRELYDKLEWMDTTIAENMVMYAQRAAMEEAFAAKMQAIDTYRQTAAANEQAAAANRMARSSGQLAKIATVAVPCTVAASIFSMNGEFAAGERLFFVYWCVAIPMTLILLGWVIQKDIVALIGKMEERWKGSTADGSSIGSSYPD